MSLFSIYIHVYTIFAPFYFFSQPIQSLD
jgi:hypothetical protein